MHLKLERDLDHKIKNYNKNNNSVDLYDILI